jgi:glycosyltransferase involved in cell wall biosynthesis
MKGSSIHIGLIEISAHPEHLASILKMANQNRYDITVFSTESNKLEIKSLVSKELFDDVSWVVKGNRRLKEFFYKISDMCDLNIDLLVNITPFCHGSLYENQFFCNFDPDCRKICYLYNMRTWTRPSTQLGRLLASAHSSITSKMDPALKYFRHLLIPEIRSNYDGFLVEIHALKKYLEGIDSFGDRTYILPPTVFEGAKESKNSTIEMVIPGRANNSVRRYDMIFEVVKRYWEKSGCDDVELIVLGPASETVERQCRELAANEYPIKYYTSYVSQSKFTETIKSCDIVLNPVHEVTKQFLPGAADEIRGQTKGSGIILDAIQFGKPLVLPDYFGSSAALNGMTKYYRNKGELLNVLRRSADDTEYLDEWKAVAERNSRQFDIENQRERLNTIVESLI